MGGGKWCSSLCCSRAEGPSHASLCRIKYVPASLYEIRNTTHSTATYASYDVQNINTIGFQIFFAKARKWMHNRSSYHMVRHPRCVFLNCNWINQLSNTTIWCVLNREGDVGVWVLWCWPLVSSYTLACVLCMAEGGWGWMEVRDLVCVE